MFGSTVLMEFRTNWKSVFVVCLLASLVAGGMTYLYPTFSDSFTEDLEGSDNVRLVVPSDGSNATLSWTHVPGAAEYVVLGDSSIFMFNASVLHFGVGNSTEFPLDSESVRYFAVLANVSGSMELVGMASSVRGSNPFEAMLDNPAYSAFTGGRSDLDLTSIRGFLSIELFSWWWILAGLFLAYYSVSVITGDFEGKRMDLLFSTPLSRERYIIEKYLFLVLMSALMVVIGGLALVGSLSSLELLGDLPAGIAFLSLFSSLPLLMLIASAGVFFGVLFQSTKMGMGVNFALVFGSFIVYTVSTLASSLDWLKYASMMYYWDYNAILLDEKMPLGPLVLVAASLAVLFAAAYRFKNMDIPA